VLCLLQAGPSDSQSRDDSETFEESSMFDDGSTDYSTEDDFSENDSSENESAEEGFTGDEVSLANTMESENSFLDHNSTIELNIWISKKSFLESGIISQLLENIQASKNGIPQFGCSNKYFEISRGTYVLFVNTEDCRFYQQSPNDIKKLVSNSDINKFLRLTIVKRDDFNEAIHLNRKKVQ